MKLEECVQLHESVEIIYVVDGYRATLTTGDGRRDVMEAHGDNPLMALVELEKMLDREEMDLKSIRKAKDLERPTLRQRVAELYKQSGTYQEQVETKLKSKVCDQDSWLKYQQESAVVKAKIELLKQLLEFEDE